MDRTIRLAHFLLPVSGFISIVLIVLGNTLWPPLGQMIAGDDTAHAFYFYKQYANHSFEQGIIPWWSPHTFTGMPFASTWSAGLFYPPNWYFFHILPLRLGFSWHIAFHLVLAMAGMYWLCRLWADRLSSWTAGVSYGLCGIVATAIYAGHNDGIAAFSYIPFVFRFFWVGMKQGRPGQLVAASLVAAWAYLTGYPVLSLFLAEAIGIVAVFFAVENKSFKPILRYLFMWISTFGLVCMQWLPNQELLGRSVRTFSLPYGWISIGALEGKYLWELVNPFIYGDQNTYFGPWQFYHERILFFGRPPLFFAVTVIIWAVITRTRRIEIWALVCVALFGLWISFAQNAPIDLMHVFWQWVPLYKDLRIPTRHVILFSFAAAALSGIGMSILKSRAAKLCIAIAVVCELIFFARHFVALMPIPELKHDADLVSILTREKGLYREVNNFNAGVPIRDALDFNAADAYGFYSSTGYDTAMLRNYYEFIDAAVGHTSPGITDNDIQVPYLNLHSQYVNFLNIKYVFTPLFMDDIGDNPGKRFILLKEQPGAWRFYQNNDALPRYFIVGSLSVYPNRKEITEAIVQNKQDLTKTVLIDASKILNSKSFYPTCKDFQNGPTIQTYQPSTIKMEIDLPCNGFLVSSEVMYPGWEAYIDGKKTDILEGNLAFRTLYIPRGHHRIEFKFIPYSVYVGMIISVGTILFLIAWMRYVIKRKMY